MKLERVNRCGSDYLVLRGEKGDKRFFTAPGLVMPHHNVLQPFELDVGKVALKRYTFSHYEVIELCELWRGRNVEIKSSVRLKYTIMREERGERKERREVRRTMEIR